MMSYEYKVLAFLLKAKRAVLVESQPQVGEELLTRWEVVHTEKMLSEMDREGWELVSVVVYEEEPVGTVQEFYFKRPGSQS